ncbi:MAG: biopolymer transporter ExbD [Acidihalobacter sp.]|uniref:ExbD/TolR family protein n=1 Tax=Acidihalobacter sp. TaxID=1872108 RepID=UPI00307E9E71
MAFGNGLDADDDMVSEINMTPLVDVMLVLLIIFIITVPVLTHSVRLDLPRADNAPDLVRPESVTLSITADGAIHWNEEAISAAALESRLLASAGRQPQPEVFIRGDREVAYENVVRVMAAVQHAGILKLAFVIEPGT